MTESHETVRPTGSMNSEVLVREFLHVLPQRNGSFPKNFILGGPEIESKRSTFLFMFQMRSEHFLPPVLNGAQILLQTRSHIPGEGLGTENY